MLKRSITYTNPFTEKEVTEEHYFHISKADLVEMEMEEHKDTYQAKDGKELTGMQAKLQRIVDSEDGKAILVTFKDIIRRAYGKKDGERFLKSKELSDEFLASEACSQLIFELCTDGKAGADFMNGIVPKNLEQIAADLQKQAAQIEPPAAGPLAEEREVMSEPNGAAPSSEPRLLTTEEIAEMDATELKSGLAENRYRLS